jgi:geranylgeranyl pyrophosphate synthase
MSKKKLMKRAILILRKRGQKALELAKESILREKIEFRPIQEALTYFMEDWEDVLHPALLSLACEAVGGDPDLTTELGASIVLLAGGADVHDDVIDQSTIKDSHPTVYGKFGKDIAILAGDALLFEGLYMLNKICEPLQKDHKQSILEIIKHAFFRVSSTEAEEASMRGNFDLPAEEYLDIIKNKVAVAVATTKIGAIIGNGTPEEIEDMGHYGKTYGTLLTIRDEFIDIYDPVEVKNRAEKECLPLPILATFKNQREKKKITQLLKRDKITEAEINQILKSVIESKDVQNLKKEMFSLIEGEKRRLGTIKKCRKILELLLTATAEDL